MSKQNETVSFTFNGKRYFARAKTVKEAAIKAERKRAELEAGIKASTRKTVNDWWKEYMEVYKHNSSDKTQKDYEGFYKKAIMPFIGSKQLKMVRPADIQNIMNNLPGKSDSYAKKTLMLLTSLFKTAVDNDLISKSPVRSVAMPKVEKGERRALTPKERKDFLQAANQCGEHGLFYLVMYYCGLRPSEVARIHGEDIDRKTNTLRVRGTKSRSSARSVIIPDALTLPPAEGYLFLTRHNNPPEKTARQKWWEEVCSKMKAPADDLTPYCLRHDYCTRLQEAGVPIDVARRLMGHSSIELTSRIYTHESTETLKSARNLINKSHAKSHTL